MATMATKRPISQVHPSRREQVPSEEPRRKRQKPSNLGKQSFKKAHPVNDLKSQIRSLKRLLSRNEDLPAPVRVEKERALQTAQHELAQTERAKQRSEIIGRWHKVRFFDRQKASKRLKKARKALAACADDVGSEERKALEQRVQDAEVDVNYAQYYPLELAYVPLFPRKKAEKLGEDGEGIDGSPEAQGETSAERQGDPEMWKKVQQCMVDGTLDSLRNERHIEVSLPHEASPAPIARRKEKKKVSREEDVDQDDEDSNGGFFE